MSTPSTASGPPRIALADRWTVDRGRIVISGVQAIARILLDQSRLDRDRGLATAGYVTGYRGSPLGTVDSMLWSIAERLNDAAIVFQPGVNEDIAATAVRGTQQLDAVPGARYDGVFAAWYGKGPGVDRSGDALKHGNYVGAHRHGGVLLFYGDDHSARSSTVAHHSEQAVAAALVPSLYPAGVEELWRYGLLGYALSRYSGSWVGLKCVTDIIEQTATIDVDRPGLAPVLPLIATRRAALPGLHAHQGSFDPLNDERIVVEERLPLVGEFVRANGIDRIVIRAPDRRVGIVTAGKAYGDVRAALGRLGLDEAACRALGISLYKVGCIWPLEADGMRDFARGHRVLVVVEEKAPFLEPQVATVVVNLADGPQVVGKRTAAGETLLSSVLALDAASVARALRTVLLANGIALRVEPDPGPADRSTDIAPARRSPYFCSGCPHNRSTRLPDGSISMAGIGCHTMANFARPKEVLLPTQMGGEGANWIGLAPFTSTKHIFQNMGDGTYYHSGLLAIRAAVAARVNITFKILYNDAVAMTGGQPIDGPISVPQIAQQVRHEGVTRVAVLSDEPASYRGVAGFPPGVTIGHRDELDTVQRELRDTPGCSVLIYEQTCAAELRRRRKRRQVQDPPRRLHIAQSVCEGCGDCSQASTCVSIVPVETAFGRKRAIDQSSCNKDMSCLNGFCPSFITVHGPGPLPKARGRIGADTWSSLRPAPVAAVAGASFNLMLAGIGGTGVVTVGAVIGMAAHIDGLAMTTFDLTGTSQKNGAVFSHVKIAREPATLDSGRIGDGEADILLAFDLIAALAPESLNTAAPGRTRAVANTAVVPNFEFQFNREWSVDPAAMVARLTTRLADEGLTDVDATRIATAVLGNSIAANMFIVGAAAQRGLLPVSISALEQAVALNGVDVDQNLDALRLGRLFVQDGAAVEALLNAGARPADGPETLDELIEHRAEHLRRYQGDALRNRYLHLVGRVRSAEAAFDVNGGLALEVARNYARLLSYKDEYEVARLLSAPELREELRTTFGGGSRFEFNLAPPLLQRGRRGERPRKRVFPAWILPGLRVLAMLKGLRGTRLDPFGWTKERQEERALIAEYERIVERVLPVLCSSTLGQIIRVLALADQVRGYGPVKEAAIAGYRAALATALAELGVSGADGNAPALSTVPAATTA